MVLAYLITIFLLGGLVFPYEYIEIGQRLCAFSRRLMWYARDSYARRFGYDEMIKLFGELYDFEYPVNRYPVPVEEKEMFWIVKQYAKLWNKFFLWYADRFGAQKAYKHLGVPILTKQQLQDYSDWVGKYIEDKGKKAKICG